MNLIKMIKINHYKNNNIDITDNYISLIGKSEYKHIW